MTADSQRGHLGCQMRARRHCPNRVHNPAHPRRGVIEALVCLAANPFLHGRAGFPHIVKQPGQVPQFLQSHARAGLGTERGNVPAVFSERLLRAAFITRVSNQHFHLFFHKSIIVGPMIASPVNDVKYILGK